MENWEWEVRVGKGCNYKNKTDKLFLITDSTFYAEIKKKNTLLNRINKNKASKFYTFKEFGKYTVNADTLKLTFNKSDDVEIKTTGVNPKCYYKIRHTSIIYMRNNSNRFYKPRKRKLSIG